MHPDVKNESDRADLTWTQEIAAGEYNRELTVEATEDGLLIDESAVVPWEWIIQAFRYQSQKREAQSEPRPSLPRA